MKKIFRPKRSAPANWPYTLVACLVAWSVGASAQVPPDAAQPPPPDAAQPTPSEGPAVADPEASESATSDEGATDNTADDPARVPPPADDAAPALTPRDTTRDATSEAESGAPDDTMSADDATGDAATGDAATGDAATGDAAMSDAATGDDATGDDATGDAATGDAAIAAARAQKAADDLERDADQIDSTGRPRIVDDGLKRLRRPVDTLIEKNLGSAARPVGFDWRDSWVHVGISGSELLERNNYGSFRLGIVARKAFLDVLVDGQVSYVGVIATESSRLLALTPYIQAGRPPRIEIDVNASYPAIEGVVTPLFNFLPPMELALLVTAGGRYMVYPGAIIGERDWSDSRTYTSTETWTDLGQSLASVQLSETDQEFVERSALPGMQLDPARVHTMLGLTVDGYMTPGMFASVRAMLNVPVLATVTNTQLGFWWELSLTLGYAF